jgi:hypothetical protein
MVQSPENVVLSCLLEVSSFPEVCAVHVSVFLLLPERITENNVAEILGLNTRFNHSFAYPMLAYSCECPEVSEEFIFTHLRSVGENYN